MKRFLVILVAVITAIGVYVPTTAAQPEQVAATTGQEVIAPVEPTSSPAARDLPAAPSSNVTPLGRFTDTHVPAAPSADTGVVDPLFDDGSSAVRAAGPVLLSAPLITWDGQSGISPNDTVGDVGPNHFVQMVQQNVQMWTKDGTSVSGPSLLSALWNDGTRDEACEFDRGDPIVLYDNLADRWLLSQFQPRAGEPGGAFQNFVCIAISQTPDPTGAYHLYAFDVGEFPDYFKIGAWSDGYYLAANGATDVPVWVFERDEMLLGNAAGAIKLGSVPNLPDVKFDVLLPSDIDGKTAPPAGTPGYFYRQVNGEVSGGVDRIDMYTATVDWSTGPPTGALSAPIAIPLAAFDGDLCGYASFGCVPQPGTTSVLDPLNEVGMFRFPYRNYGDREVLAGNFTVDVNGANGHGIRWFVLERTGGGAWGVQDQGTFSEQPSGAPAFVHHFMGSLAMDRNGNLAIGHTASSAQVVYPSARYVGRAASDPPGALQAEQTMKAGTGSLRDGPGYRGNFDLTRWGDYYSLIVDPVDDCTFWYTGDYGVANGSLGLRQSVVGSFRFSDCGPISAQVEASATNLAGAPHTFTLSAFGDTPGGPVPANGAIFNYSWTGATAATPPATCTAAATENTCEVTVTSAVAGEGTIAIDTVDAMVDGTAFTDVTPSATAGGSLSATKKWVAISANVEASATNLAGAPHTFTLTAFADTPMGNVPADGATFNYTWTGATAATPPATCTAAATENTCTVTVNSATAAEGTITIDTVDATVDGTAFTDVTPSTTAGGSLSATKKWVAISANVEASATNLAGAPHTFTLTAFADTPMGNVPADGATFNYTWTGATAATPPATCTAATTENTCEVTVNSAIAGEGTITINTVDATVDGTAFTDVTPSTTAGGSLSATKKWVASSADLSITVAATTTAAAGTFLLTIDDTANLTAATAKVGDTVAYTLTVSNSGPQPATSAVVTQVFPAGLSNLQVVDSDPYQCQIIALTMTCTLASHDVGIVATIRVSATVASGAGSEINSTVTVSSQTADPVLANNATALAISVAAVVAPTTTTTTAPAPTATPPVAGLPITGSSSVDVLWLALLVLMIGAGATLLARRSRRHI